MALLGVAAAGAFILRTWPPTVVVPSPGPPVVIVDPSPAPGLVWQTTTIPAMFAGGNALPVAVAGGGTGFAAVGPRVFRDLDTPSGGAASAWGSADGMTWAPATSVADLAVGDGVYIDDYPSPGLVDVAWGPAGFVAVGVSREANDRVGGTWLSSDGLSWTRSDLPEPARAHPSAVTWNGSTYIVVGVVEEESAPRAAAWLSTDGRSWHRVPDGDAFDIGGYITYPAGVGSGGPADVTAAWDGAATDSSVTVFAAGRTCSGTASMEEQPVCRPLLMKSGDGETWTRIAIGADEPPNLSSIAATATRTVAVAGAVGATSDPARVIVADDAGWRLIVPSGVPRLDRVVTFDAGFVALSTAGNQITLWTSPDGEEWTAVPGIPQPADVTVLREHDLAIAGTQVVIVGSAEVSSAAGMVGYAIVGSTQLLRPADETPAPSPSPSPPPAAAWQPAPNALPVASGTAQLAAGPDGGTYVLVSTAGDATAGRPVRSVLALLAASGNPQPGWPLAVDGWYCDDPSGRPMPPETTSDGSVTVGCHSAETADGSVWTSVSRFDTTGRRVGSWSYRGEVAGRLRIVDDRLLLVTNEPTERQVTGPGGAVETRSLVVHWIQEVSEDGTVRSGVRVEMDDADWYSAIGPDGTAYHVNRVDGVITAFDMDGQRAGWPVRLGGPPFRPRIRARRARLRGRGVIRRGATRLVSLGRDGSVEWRTDPLALAGASSRTGGGPFGPLAPLVMEDGTAIVIGESGGRAVLYAIDPTGRVKTGWPHRSATPPAWQGACAADAADCGVWRSIPAVGADGAVYVPLAAPDAQIGGTMEGVDPDGHALAGWPMHLARRGAAFWSVAVGTDGTAFCLAVEPETGGTTSATIVAIARDGTVRSRTTVIQP